MPDPVTQRAGLPFRISPRLIDLFGRELVARAEGALAELVKNAYDSDATRVQLKFRDVKQPGGNVTITDDGDGMNLEDLEKKWMLIGTKNKLDEPLTRKRRRKVGEKGIGRLGAHKLSNRTILRTKKRGSSEWIVLDIDWAKYYTESQSFEEIRHPLTAEPGKVSDHGTKLELLDLRDGFSKEHFERLQAELTLLVPPLPGIRDFKIEILSEEFPEFRGELQPQVLKAATYHVEAKFDGKQLTGSLHVNGVAKAVPINRELEALRCGPLELSIYVYVLKKESFEGTPLQYTKVQKILDIYKGIRIYRDKFKVGLYGDQGNDWLGIDAQHIRRHEVMIHSKQVMGAVRISRDSSPELLDTTNREGLVANQAYFDLVTVAGVAIDEVNTQRWREREARERQRAKGAGPVHEALHEIENALAKDLLIPRPVKDEVHDLLQKVRLEQANEATRMEDELQMYRNLASLGISTAAFAHETEAIGLDLNLYIGELAFAIDALPPAIAHQLLPSFQKVVGVSGRSSQLVEMFLEFVRNKKQKPTGVRPSAIAKDLINRYKPFLKNIALEIKEAAAPAPDLWCVPMDIEAILLNLLTNAVYATRKKENRRILIQFSIEGKNHVVLFSDNGVGIPPADAEKVFFPFFTSKGPLGIGLGLTIVRDTIRKYGGDIKTVIPGKLGGATFQITFPTATPK